MSWKGRRPANGCYSHADRVTFNAIKKSERAAKRARADFEKAQAERKAAHNKQYERDRNGLTLAQIQEVIAAQDGDPSQLWKRSQSWTKAQRKYAQSRYQEIHGLFAQTWNP